MAKTWVQLSDSQREKAAQDFVTQSATADLLQAAMAKAADETGGVSRNALFNELYRVATGPMPLTAKLQAALSGDAGLNADFRALISRVSAYQFPLAAAASSGGVESRTGDGFDITLKQSRAQPDQLYVLLTLKPDAPMEPKSLFVGLPDGNFIKQALPDPLNGVIQILTEAGAPLVEALKDTQAEVYLR